MAISPNIVIFLEAYHSSDTIDLSHNATKARVLGKEIWPWMPESSILLKRLLRRWKT
jgi:hypothetical protein